MAVSTLFVTTASTETLNGTIAGFLSSLFGQARGAKPKLHPKSYRSAKETHYEMSLCHHTNRVEIPKLMCCCDTLAIVSHGGRRARAEQRPGAGTMVVSGTTTPDIHTCSCARGALLDMRCRISKEHATTICSCVMDVTCAC